VPKNNGKKQTPTQNFGKVPLGKNKIINPMIKIIIMAGVILTPYNSGDNRCSPFNIVINMERIKSFS
jgi:hypothetical protein